MQAPQVKETTNKPRTTVAWWRVLLVCTLAIGALHFAQQATTQNQGFSETKLTEDELGKKMLRDALIKDAVRNLPAKKTPLSTVKSSGHDYTHPSLTTLKSSLIDLDVTKHERRKRLNARGEDIGDMHADGHMTMRDVFDRTSLLSKGAR